MAPRSDKQCQGGVESMIWDPTSTQPSSKSSLPHTRRKSVQFSLTLQVHTIQRCERNAVSVKKNSAKEVERYRDDVRKSVQAISSLPNFSSLTEHPDDICTQGIEHLLTREKCNELMKNRLDQINAVLDEQERQDELGIWDPEAIAFVSSKHSRWARKRALELGEYHYTDR